MQSPAGVSCSICCEANKRPDEDEWEAWAAADGMEWIPTLEACPPPPASSAWAISTWILKPLSQCICGLHGPWARRAGVQQRNSKDEPDESTKAAKHGPLQRVAVAVRQRYLTSAPLRLSACAETACRTRAWAFLSRVPPTRGRNDIIGPCGIEFGLFFDSSIGFPICQPKCHMLPPSLPRRRRRVDRRTWNGQFLFVPVPARIMEEPRVSSTLHAACRRQSHFRLSFDPLPTLSPWRTQWRGWMETPPSVGMSSGPNGLPNVPSHPSLCTDTVRLMEKWSYGAGMFCLVDNFGRMYHVVSRTPRSSGWRAR
ncbi:hypothetical protein LZ30DRAFT_303279 [Colletotrichum cereale]|nr:hypothetical protein LZ30DRAFT_303279 [Colletotrichum cereale]